MGQIAHGMMRATSLDRFGGPDVLTETVLPLPEVGVGEVLICVEFAGVGEWDPFEREGGYAEIRGIDPKTPYVLGSEGAGAIAAVGAHVDRFDVGDRVYAPAFLNPKGGFYAEYVAVDAALVFPIPSGLTIEQAGVILGVGVTALRGLADTLDLQRGESIMIFGASGGVGHLAVQIAKRMGARVLAVASGEDGVALVKQLGSDSAVDGHTDDVLAAARAFAPEGLDAALLTAGGEIAERAIQAMRPGGRIAFPYGIHPEPLVRSGIQSTGYYADPDPEIIRRLHLMIESGPLTAHVARTFPLAHAAEAHLALGDHYLGKIGLQVKDCREHL